MITYNKELKKSHNQLKLDNFAKDVVRMLPNGKSLFLGGNGRILQKRISPIFVSMAIEAIFILSNPFQTI